MRIILWLFVLVGLFVMISCTSSPETSKPVESTIGKHSAVVVGKFVVREDSFAPMVFIYEIDEELFVVTQQGGISPLGRMK